MHRNTHRKAHRCGWPRMTSGPANPLPLTILGALRYLLPRWWNAVRLELIFFQPPLSAALHWVHSLRMVVGVDRCADTSTPHCLHSPISPQWGHCQGGGRTADTTAWACDSSSGSLFFKCPFLLLSYKGMPSSSLVNLPTPSLEGRNSGSRSIQPQANQLQWSQVTVANCQLYLTQGKFNFWR